MEQTERHSRYEICYPRPLREAEDRLVAARHGGVLPAHRMGVALSGGGIRSATFCLGVFQTLARQRLLKRIDYLSTVSGGGYFGSFLGRLFSRDFVKTVEDVEGILAPAESPTRLGEWNPAGSSAGFVRTADTSRRKAPATCS
jgi:predicted acylesterase/phospholipase RssA